MLKCVVSAQTNRDGSAKMSPKGETYTQIEWTAIPQTLEDIQRGRTHLGVDTATAPAPAATVAAPATPVAAQPVAAVAQPAAAQPAAGSSMATLLGALKR